MASFGMGKMARREALWGYAMIAPLVIGLADLFLPGARRLAVPELYRVGRADGTQVGRVGQLPAFLREPAVLKTLWNTLRFALMLVPLGMIASLGMALALNQNIRMRGIYRVIFFSAGADHAGSDRRGLEVDLCARLRACSTRHWRW